MCVCVWGERCNFDQGCRGGLLEEMTFDQFEKEVRSGPGGSLGKNILARGIGHD